jgi:hypothetical protein
VAWISSKTQARLITEAYVIATVVPKATPVAIRIGRWTEEHSNFAASIQKLLDFLLNGIA